MFHQKIIPHKIPLSLRLSSSFSIDKSRLCRIIPHPSNRPILEFPLDGLVLVSNCVLCSTGCYSRAHDLRRLGPRQPSAGSASGSCVPTVSAAAQSSIARTTSHDGAAAFVSMVTTEASTCHRETGGCTLHLSCATGWGRPRAVFSFASRPSPKACTGGITKAFALPRCMMNPRSYSVRMQICSVSVLIKPGKASADWRKTLRLDDLMKVKA